MRLHENQAQRTNFGSRYNIIGSCSEPVAANPDSISFLKHSPTVDVMYLPRPGYPAPQEAPTRVRGSKLYYLGTGPLWLRSALEKIEDNTSRNEGRTPFTRSRNLLEWTDLIVWNRTDSANLGNRLPWRHTSFLSVETPTTLMPQLLLDVLQGSQSIAFITTSLFSSKTKTQT